MKWLAFEAVKRDKDNHRVIYRKEYLCKNQYTGMKRFVKELKKKGCFLPNMSIYCTQMRLF